MLTLYDPTKYHEEHTDASKLGITEIMFRQEEDEAKPDGYAATQRADIQDMR